MARPQSGPFLPALQDLGFLIDEGLTPKPAYGGFSTSQEKVALDMPADKKIN